MRKRAIGYREIRDKRAKLPTEYGIRFLLTQVQSEGKKGSDNRLRMYLSQSNYQPMI